MSFRELLVSRFRSSRGYDLIWVGLGYAVAEPSDRSEYVVGGFHPSERSWVVVDGVDIVEDGAFEFGDGAVDAAPDLPLDRQAEEPLDPIEPRRRCRDEVDMPVLALGEPPDGLGLVGGVVVHDDVDAGVVWRVGFHTVEKPDELAAPAAPEAAPDDTAGGDVEGGEQRRRAVALVVVGAPFGLAGAHTRAVCGRGPVFGFFRQRTAPVRRRAG